MDREYLNAFMGFLSGILSVYLGRLIGYMYYYFFLNQ